MGLLTRIASIVIPRRWQPAAIDARLAYARAHDAAGNAQTLAGALLGPRFNTIAARHHGGSEINNYEMKFHSQHGEDGILLYIFSMIGATNRRFVEIGGGSGDECNTANLALYYGWSGLLVDGSEQQATLARFYFDHRLGPRHDVRVISRFVTTENVNDITREIGLAGEIDLLSIDIDGNDYWVWKAITEIDPRVVVIEYNACLGVERSVTVKYDPGFVVSEKDPGGFYHGASLAALTKLANSRGYALVGCDSSGANAFYVRRDAAADGPAEVSVRQAYFPSRRRWRDSSAPDPFDLIKNLEFEEV